MHPIETGATSPELARSVIHEEHRNGHSMGASVPGPSDSRSPIELELTNPVFVGPLALLLELIEARRLPITAVSIAEVADQYMDRIRSLRITDPDLLSDFLVMAARLLVIKSRALLPSRPVGAAEESPAEDLEQRLLEYRIFRDAADRLREMYEDGRRSFPRRPEPAAQTRPEPPLGPIPPDSVRAAMARMMKALRSEAEPLDMVPQVSVRDRMEQLMALLAARGPAAFSEVAGQTVAVVVATFLAVLELVRRGLVCARQGEPFAEISLELTSGRAE
jgi:segregation and condensation protein A